MNNEPCLRRGFFAGTQMTQIVMINHDYHNNLRPKIKPEVGMINTIFIFGICLKLYYFSLHPIAL